MEKEGDINDSSKYREIALLSHCIKTLERILDARIRKETETNLVDEQHGFRAGKSTIDVFNL